jgi:glutathione S-transferase
MIELVQFPWSPFCLVQKRILDFARIRYKLTNVSPTDRTRVWKMTKQRYYQVPVLRDGANVLFETEENSQVLAKYLDEKLHLGLFPHAWDGVQDLLWRYIENEVEAMTFKLNDAHFEEFVPKSEQMAYRRHKERKFGRSCLEQWREGQDDLRDELTHRLVPFEQMLAHREFLLDGEPRFVDFDLWGMLANLTYTKKNELPKAHEQLRRWFARMTNIKTTAAPASGSKLRK